MWLGQIPKLFRFWLVLRAIGLVLILWRPCRTSSFPLNTLQDFTLFPQTSQTAVRFAGQHVSLNYFSKESYYGQYQFNVLKLSEYITALLPVLKPVCSPLFVPSAQTFRQLQQKIPNPGDIPPYYQMHLMHSTLNDILRSPSQTMGFFWIVINDMVNTLYDEIEALIVTEWSSQLLFSYSTQHILNDLLQTLIHLNEAIGKTHQYCASKIVYLKRFYQLLVGLPDFLFSLSETSVDMKPKPSVNEVEAYKNLREPQIHTYTYSIYPENVKLWAQDQIKQLIMDQNFWLKPSSQLTFKYYQHSNVYTFDGLPVQAEYFLPLKLHFSMQLKVSPDLQQITHLALDFKPGASDHLIKNSLLEHHSIKRLVTQFIREHLMIILAHMPYSLQQHITQYTITQNGFLYHSLHCKRTILSRVSLNNRPISRIRSHLYLDFPDIFSYPIRLNHILLKNLRQNESPTSPSVDSLLKFHALYFIPRFQLRFNTSTATLDTFLLCDWPPIVPSYQHHVTVEYPAPLDLENPSHTFWALCTERYPNGTKFMIHKEIPHIFEKKKTIPNVKRKSDTLQPSEAFTHKRSPQAPQPETQWHSQHLNTFDTKDPKPVSTVFSSHHSTMVTNKTTMPSPKQPFHVHDVWSPNAKFISSGFIRLQSSEFVHPETSIPLSFLELPPLERPKYSSRQAKRHESEQYVVDSSDLQFSTSIFENISVYTTQQSKKDLVIPSPPQQQLQESDVSDVDIYICKPINPHT